MVLFGVNMNARQTKIIEIIKAKNVRSFSDISKHIDSVSPRTLSRDLSELVALGFLETEGKGRSLVYNLPVTGRFFAPIDSVVYNQQEPDKRAGVLAQYQFDVWQQWPRTLFSDNEHTHFKQLTATYQNKISQRSNDVHARELERFVIEMSWKSSRIEGNTYTLLDTELLLRDGIVSNKNSKEETQMILNHKTAFNYVREQSISDDTRLTRVYVEKVQSLLMQGLLTDVGLRKNPVGITGSNYRPLDNQFQIQEAFESLVETINNRENVFDKALTALLGISYIQPFVDGNKRTARLVANGILLQGSAAPLSYRNVDESNYRASLLVFYEQMSVVAMRQIFVDQYAFATRHYS